MDGYKIGDIRRRENGKGKEIKCKCRECGFVRWISYQSAIDPQDKICAACSSLKNGRNAANMRNTGNYAVKYG